MLYIQVNSLGYILDSGAVMTLALSIYEKNQLRHFNQENLSFFFKVIEEQIISRIDSLCLSIIFGITLGIEDLMDLGDELIGGLLTLDKEQLATTPISFAAFFINAIALPLIGALGLLFPALSLCLATKINQLTAPIFVPINLKEAYGPYTLRVMCLIKGVTTGVRLFCEGSRRSLSLCIGLSSAEEFRFGLKELALSPFKPLQGISTAIALRLNPSALANLKLATITTYEVM